MAHPVPDRPAASASSYPAAEESYSAPSIASDPLSEEQKRRIYKFVQSYLISDRDTEVSTYRGQQTVKAPLIPMCTDEANSKTYDSFDPEALERTRAAVDDYHVSKGDGKTFEIFRRILKDPRLAAEELGIDATTDPQVFATQMFMKIVIRNTNSHTDFDELLAKYRNKMGSERGGGGRVPQAISGKNLLLMQNDPVEKLDPRAAPTSLSIVLSHVYFQDQKSFNMSTQIWGVHSRDFARASLKMALTSLYEKEETRHVIDALAALMTREKGNIFFGGVEVEKLMAPYSSGIGIFGQATNNHSIIMAPFLDITTTDLRPESMGTFIHESLHMLFNRILNNTSSPVATGSEEERQLDHALDQDRAHRVGITRGELSEQEDKVYNRMVSGLEKNTDYFSPEFRSWNPRHAHLMRVESIVVIMEQVAQGVSVEAIQRVAPNLCAFYLAYCKPMLEDYARAAV